MTAVAPESRSERDTVAAFLALPGEAVAARVTDRLRVRASPRRDAAVEIVQRLALMPAFARQDVHAPVAGLADRYATRTIDRARDALERAGLVETVAGESTQGAGQGYRVALERLVD